MKEDHMLNGQLKPAYNVQIGTEHGYVLSYGLFSNPTDTRTLQPHLESFKENNGSYPAHVIADKGYGSYENYRELEQRQIEALIKYPHWDQEKKKRSKKYRYRPWRFQYDETRDELWCPEQKRLSFIFERNRQNYSKTEYQRVRVYECESCDQCPSREACTRRAFRRVELNPDRIRLYRKARDRIRTEEGWIKYRKRGAEVETVFGQIKGNLGYRRFNTWGHQSVANEWGLHMIGYNLRRLATQIAGG